jgi:hypothetical protein
MWVLSVVFGTLRLAVVCDGVQEPVFEQPERPVIGFAEPLAGLDDFVEHRLDS